MSKPEKRARPFDLKVSLKDPFLQKAFLLLQGWIERCFHLERLNDIYDELSAVDDQQTPFPARVLKALNVNYSIPPEDLARIPRTGAVITVSNHPFGAMEGVVLATILRSIRPDARIMANYLLARLPEMREYFIFVDPFGTAGAAHSNIRPLKESIKWLKNGGLLSIFPAGEVAHIDLQKRRIEDPAWSEDVARLVRHTGAPVLPIYFEGCNGPLFQIAGLLHPRLRTVMLPREFLNKEHQTLHVRVGQLIPLEKLTRFDANADLMDYLRLRTYILGRREDRSAAGRLRRRLQLPALARLGRVEQPLADPMPAAALAADLAALPAEQEIVAMEDFRVYYARAAQLPNILPEIGRLREMTFRQANEGTGQARDLDRFDKQYLHLFVWNVKQQELVGAYRLGQTDVILRRQGIRGLYTSTLFKYKRALLDQLDPALEMGRSFVRPEYQKNYSALFLLWKGIAAYIARHPRYSNLFGPVSINNEYQSTSRQLLVRFLEMNNFVGNLAHLIKPRHPLRERSIPSCDPQTISRTIKSIDEVSELISEIEQDHKGIPILLKQYLKLGGKLLAFNIDPDFSFVLDGLLWVDLTKTDEKILYRYLGKEGFERFTSYHKMGKHAEKPAE